MKAVLFLLTSATFTACQCGIRESQSYDRGTRRSIPEYVPVHIQYDPPQAINNYNDYANRETKSDIGGNYAIPTPAEPSPPAGIPEQQQPKSRQRNPKKSIDGGAYIVKYSNINNGFDGYRFGYETSNGISRNEQLTFRDTEKYGKTPDIEGGYEFTDPLGRRVVVTYTAGIAGFKPIIRYL